jgi:hypothetical protein
MKNAVEVGSGGIIYIPSYIKTGSGIQKLTGGIHRQIPWRSYRPTFIFSK